MMNITIALFYQECTSHTHGDSVSYQLWPHYCYSVLHSYTGVDIAHTIVYNR